MKIGAVYCLYDDCDFLEVSIESIKNVVDHIVFLVSSVPWYGNVSENSSTINKIKKLCEKNPNFVLIHGHWINEADQRNFGIQYLYSKNIEYCFIIDTDEVYDVKHVIAIKNFVLEHINIVAFHIEWNTYWSKQYYVISPRENFKPVIVVKNENFIFTKMRQGVTSIQRANSLIFNSNQKVYNGILIPKNLAFCYHLSYARTDEQIKRKIETFSHAKDVDKYWFDNVWKKWTPELKNLHPITPSQYKQAIKENFLNFPNHLKIFIKKEKIACSILIINFNSYELLIRCLNLVKLNTKALYEIIIVDNGSENLPNDFENSVKPYNIKRVIYNKKNLGFPKAVNQAIKIADKNTDICLLNVDAEPQENWLENMYETLNNNALAGIVGPLGNEIENGYQKEKMVDKDIEVFNVHFYCVLIFRELINRIGLLDEIFGLGSYEDNDYCIRAMLSGYQCWISANSLVRHKAHQVFDLNKIDRLELENKNKQLLQNKLIEAFYKYGIELDLFSMSKEIAKNCRLLIDYDY